MTFHVRFQGSVHPKLDGTDGGHASGIYNYPTIQAGRIPCNWLLVLPHALEDPPIHLLDKYAIKNTEFSGSSKFIYMQIFVLMGMRCALKQSNNHVCIGRMSIKSLATVIIPYSTPITYAYNNC